MLTYQRDFKNLFAVLKKIYTLKQAWRNKAIEVAEKTAELAEKNTTVLNPLGEGFTEFRPK